jgi:spore coat protein U-like protein
MNIRLSRVAVLATALISFGAMADSQNLSVTATVAAACKLTAIPAMAFSLDPAVGTVQTQTSTIQYRCTKGANAGAFTVNGVSTGTSAIVLAGTGANTDTIGVALSWTNPSAYAGVGFTAGAAKSVTVTGTVAANTYDVTADTYSKNVPIAILP